MFPVFERNQFSTKLSNLGSLGTISDPHGSCDCMPHIRQSYLSYVYDFIIHRTFSVRIRARGHFMMSITSDTHLIADLFPSSQSALNTLRSAVSISCAVNIFAA